MDEMKNMDEVEKKDNMVSDNMVSTVLVILAWLIFIGGFIAGIVCGRVETGYLSEKNFHLPWLLFTGFLVLQPECYVMA